MANERDLVVAVERGARYLDEHEPGWEDKIVLEQLRMKSCLRCVIGQLYGDFFKVFPGAQWEEAWAGGRKALEDWEEACFLGFAVEGSIDEDYDIEQVEQDYQVLTDLWIATIHAKRG